MTYKEIITDAVTGEETERPFTDEEIEALETRKIEIASEIAKRDAEQAAKDAARQAVLDKLGLSADEVAALLA